MNIVYKNSVLEQIKIAKLDAAKTRKDIDYVELTGPEFEDLVLYMRDNVNPFFNDNNDTGVCVVEGIEVRTLVLKKEHT